MDREDWDRFRDQVERDQWRMSVSTWKVCELVCRRLQMEPHTLYSYVQQRRGARHPVDEAALMSYARGGFPALDRATDLDYPPRPVGPDRPG